MIIDALLDEAAQVGLATTLEDHWSRVEAFDTRFTDTVDRAAFGGFSSDRLGFAFVAGYRAALQRLVPSLGGRRACLCATEEGGAHPRAIKATLADGRLRGTKTFATLASHAEELLVVVSVGEREGRNELRVARIPRSRAGVVVEEKAPWPVAPEIPHAIVRFEDVAVAEGDLLEGDGYARYLKPQRRADRRLGACLTRNHRRVDLVASRDRCVRSVPTWYAPRARWHDRCGGARGRDPRLLEGPE